MKLSYATHTHAHTHAHTHIKTGRNTWCCVSAHTKHEHSLSAESTSSRQTWKVLSENDTPLYKSNRQQNNFLLFTRETIWKWNIVFRADHIACRRTERHIQEFSGFSHQLQQRHNRNDWMETGCGSFLGQTYIANHAAVRSKAMSNLFT